MGVELSVAALWIRRDRDPDWVAARRAVRDLSLATVWNTGDDLFPLEAWFEEVQDPPAPRGVYFGLRAAQTHLQEVLDEVRGAVEAGMHFVTLADLSDHLVFFTGCIAGGDPPPDPFGAFCDFGEAGLAVAAGFEGATRYCAVPFEDRSSEFVGDDSRAIAATRALMFAEDLALEGPLGDALFTAVAPADLGDLWLEPLRAAAEEDDVNAVLRALMLHAAQTYALLHELWWRESEEDELESLDLPPRHSDGDARPAGAPRLAPQLRWRRPRPLRRGYRSSGALGQ